MEQNRPFEEFQRERRFLVSRRMGDVCFGMTAPAVVPEFFSACCIWKDRLLIALLPVMVTLDHWLRPCMPYLSKVSISRLVIIRYLMARDLETVM